ncbi:MAG: cytochrome c [Chthoniobacter sp.]|uniref:c-type cytochrome n=1 Tax=Chthoniobacter sp. TaxID=2510640 RepID=UPI0032A9F83A
MMPPSQISTALLSGPMQSVRRFTVSSLATAVITFAIHAQAQTATPWVAPADAAAIRNPSAGNTAAAAAGKQTYAATCAACHGATGRGDGPAAAALNPKPANYTTPAVEAESDGSLFWKLSEGRGAMAPFKSALSEKQRWELVTYIRTLGPGSHHAKPVTGVPTAGGVPGATPKVARPTQAKTGTAPGVLPTALPPTLPIGPAAVPETAGALSGVELWSINCNRCHTYRASNEYTAAQWQNLLLHMRVRANLPAAQAREILKFLQAGAGK